MPKTVLIADESVTIRSVAESLLRGESFSVHSAGDGLMALELARGEKPDLALIAEKLPGLSGAEICAAIKADPDLGNMPIIFMRTDRPGQPAVNVDAVLTKPFSPQSLLDAVRRFLSAGEVAGVTDSFVALEEEKLDEELIDQALGLDSVGPLPAEEREVAVPPSDEEEEWTPATEATTASPEADDAPAQQDPSRVEEASVALQQSEGVAAEPPSDHPESGPQDELDRALDQVFGGSIHELPAEEASAAGLQEISLGDDASPPEELALGRSPASNSESESLQADRVPGSPPEDLGPERPHDYDWFINEVEKGAAAEPGSTHAPSPEPPRIEPLVARDEPGSELTSVDSSAIRLEADADEKAGQPGYNEFISEFRREIARLEGEPSATDDDVTRHSSKSAVALGSGEADRGGEPPGADPIMALGDRLIESVSQHVARELAAQIDHKVIYALIEARLKETRDGKVDN